MEATSVQRLHVEHHQQMLQWMPKYCKACFLVTSVLHENVTTLLDVFTQTGHVKMCESEIVNKSQLTAEVPSRNKVG